jgi:hypothetical protein
MTLFAAEPGTDESDSEGGYLDHEGVGGLDELSSTLRFNLAIASLMLHQATESTCFPSLPFSLH